MNDIVHWASVEMEGGAGETREGIDRQDTTQLRGRRSTTPLSSIQRTMVNRIRGGADKNVT